VLIFPAEGENLISKKRLLYFLGAKLQRENRRDGEEESQEEIGEEGFLGTL